MGKNLEGNVSRCQKYLEELLSDGNFGNTVVVLLELPDKAVWDEVTGLQTYEDAPNIPDRYQEHFRGSTSGIILPNDKCLWYCAFSKEGLIAFLQDPETRNSYRAASWAELFESDYEYWDFVFKAEGERFNVSGEYSPWRGKFTELLPGDKFIKAAIPCVFSGEKRQELTIGDEKRKKSIPRQPKMEGPLPDMDFSKVILFMPLKSQIKISSRKPTNSPILNVRQF